MFAMAITALQTQFFQQSPVTPKSPRSQQSESLSDSSWSSVFRALDHKRGHALATRDVSLLADVFVVGSAAYEQDKKLIENMISQSVIASAPRSTVIEVVESFRRFEGESVVAHLEVTDTLSGYSLSGGITSTIPPRGPKAWNIVMRRVSTTTPWRIESITAKVPLEEPTR